MKEVSLQELEIGVALSGYLCHKSGEILHRPGDTVSRVQRALMHQCGIDTLLQVDDEAGCSELRESRQYRHVPLNAIPVGEPVPVALFTSENTSVCKENEVFTQKMHASLAGGAITELIGKKDEMELELFQVHTYKHLLESEKGESLEQVADPDSFLLQEKTEEVSEEADAAEPVPDEPIPADHCILQPSKAITPAFCKQLMGQPDSLHVAVEKTAMKAPAGIFTEREHSEKMEYKRAYLRWASNLATIFSQLKSNRETDFGTIETIAREMVEYYFSDCFYCLNLMNLRYPPATDNYLPMHCVNVAIASIGVGVKIGYSLPQLRELVVGALLHDVGHLKTYKPLMLKKDLDSSEQHKYDQHAVVGTAMLKNISKVPLSTVLVVTQHHEYCDGSGRIYHASAKQLHDFARLVGVVDYFESACRFGTATTALVHAVRSAQAKLLDIRFCKAMLEVLSLYPVGVSLRLGNGMICKVIGTNPGAFKTPVLRSVYTMSDEHLFPIDSSEVIDLAEKRTITVIGELQHSALKNDIAQGF